MKGLLLKDFYTIWKAGRIFIILYIFIAAVSGMNLQNGWSYMGFWMVMMDAQTLSTFSYDHSCNWNRFALTMPVTRKDVVQSKFLLQLLIVFGSMLAYLVLAALVSLVLRTFEVKAFCNMLLAAWLVFWVVLLMGSVSTPAAVPVSAGIRAADLHFGLCDSGVCFHGCRQHFRSGNSGQSCRPACGVFRNAAAGGDCHTHTVPGGLRTVLFLQLPCLSEERSDITGKERFA